MARKLVIGVSLGIIVLVVGGLLLSGIIPLPETNASSMELIFYDADGNELGKTDGTLGIFGIQSPDLEPGDIHSIDVVVYFKLTTDIVYTSITSKCDLSVKTEVNTLSPTRMGVVHTVAEHQLGAINSDLEGTFYANYLMSTLLPDSKTDADKDIGWKMYFNAKVTSVIWQGTTDNIIVEDTCVTTLILSWAEPSVVLESWFGNW